MPADDSRRTTLFGSAMVAYAAYPHQSFLHLVTACWHDVTKQMAESAIDSILKHILDKKDDGEYGALGYASAKGTVSFSSREDGELFDLMHLVRAINPKRADEIIETRQELRNWLEIYPKGTESVQAEGMFWSFVTMGDDKADVQRGHKQQEVRIFAESQATKAVNAAKEDVDKAIGLAQTIPMPDRRAEVLGNIARTAAGKDQTKARGAVTKCTAALEEVKIPADRIAAWDALAEAAELYKDDEKAEVPNIILREYWLSTQAYRRVVMRATKILGVDAEPMLLKISDKDVNLLARIEMAQALLGRPHENWQTFPPRKRKN